MAGCKLGDPFLCNHSEDEVLRDIQGVQLLGLGLVSVAFVVHATVHRKGWEMIPESLITVVVGLIMGFILWASPLLGTKSSLDEGYIQWMFSIFLNLVCLPVIIFESGWSIRIRDFVSQFGYIMVFAIIGTIAAVGIIAGLLWATRDYHAVKDLRLCFAMASLISSVDPVSTLATFGNLNVDSLLYILIFGESQINDAVAITFFRSLNQAEEANMSLYVLEMLKVFFGSVGVGVGLAMLLIFVFRFGHIGHSPVQSVLLIFVSCFFTFTAGELAGFSGIIAVLFNSILLGCYLTLYLSSEAMALTSFLLKQMSSLADTMIFLFSGIVGVSVVLDGRKSDGLLLGLILSVICLIARCLTIFPLGCLSNLVKRRVGRHLPKEQDIMITWKHMFMMCHSGLRGGISLVLVIGISGRLVPDSAVKTTLINAVFVMVVLYLLVFGSSIGLALRCLGLPLGDQVKEGSMFEDEDKQGYAWKLMMVIRDKIMLPLLAPCEPRENRPEDGRQSVMVDALRDAGEVQVLARSTTQRLARASARSIWANSSALMNMFGTVDPAHMCSRVNLTQDVSGLMRRRSSALASRRDIDGGRRRPSFSDSEGSVSTGVRSAKSFDQFDEDQKDAGTVGMC